MSRLLRRSTHTLVIIKKDDSLLLGRKKTGSGVGKCTGFGGIVEPDESITDAALRYVLEQCGLEAEELKKVGAYEVEFQRSPEIKHVHVFLCESFRGRITETGEMLPKWYKLDNLPFHSMWTDHYIWMPDLLMGVNFHGYFHYNDRHCLLRKRYKAVEMHN